MVDDTVARTSVDDRHLSLLVGHVGGESTTPALARRRERGCDMDEVGRLRVHCSVTTVTSRELHGYHADSTGHLLCHTIQSLVQ